MLTRMKSLRDKIEESSVVEEVKVKEEKKVEKVEKKGK